MWNPSRILSTAVTISMVAFSSARLGAEDDRPENILAHETTTLEDQEERNLATAKFRELLELSFLKKEDVKQESLSCVEGDSILWPTTNKDGEDYKEHEIKSIDDFSAYIDSGLLAGLRSAPSVGLQDRQCKLDWHDPSVELILIHTPSKRWEQVIVIKRDTHSELARGSTLYRAKIFKDDVGEYLSCNVSFNALADL